MVSAAEEDSIAIAISTAPLVHPYPQPAMRFALGWSPDLIEAAEGTARLVRAAMGLEVAGVGVYLPDRQNRLHAAGAAGSLSNGASNSSELRRQAFKTMRAPSVQLVGPHWVRAVLPLVYRGESLGVLEVEGPQLAVEDSRKLLEATAQAAAHLGNVRELEALRDRVQGWADLSTLTQTLLSAKTPEGAVRETVRFCFERFQVPIAAWLAKGNQDRLTLTAVRGLGSKKRDQLNSRMSTLPRMQTHSSGNRSQALVRFENIVGVTGAVAIEAGDAVLFASGVPASLTRSVATLGVTLQSVLSLLSVVASAEERNEGLDLGIAWTAHEFRGLLVGAKAALDRLLRTPGQPKASRQLLRRSRRELGQVAGLTEALLHWAVRPSPLRRRPTDLVRLVRNVRESCAVAEGRDRVTMSAPPRLMLRGDAAHIRVAVANVVRNALAYSPPDTEVEVTVKEDGDFVTVSVKDEGPPIPKEERHSIFDPFLRGRAGRVTRGGKGLGLFVAKKVVEAHGGSIWLESNSHSVTFFIRLPMQTG